MMRGSRGGQGVPDPPPPEKFKFLKITLPEILLNETNNGNNGITWFKKMFIKVKESFC